MLLFSRRTLLFIAGALWLVSGITCMTWGIFFIIQAAALPPSSSLSLIDFFTAFVKRRSDAALLLITLGLYLGYLIGRFSISRQVGREAKRLSLLPSPLSIRYLFSGKTLLLYVILLTLCLFFLIFRINGEMSGFFNLFIGSSLINGGVTYLRKAIILEDL